MRIINTEHETLGCFEAVGGQKDTYPPFHHHWCILSPEKTERKTTVKTWTNIDQTDISIRPKVSNMI